MGGVDAQELDPEAPERVGSHVHREQPSGAEADPPFDEQYDRHHREVPQALVEERGMEGGELLVARRPVAGVDAQRPRQGARAAEELLVEPVSPASDGLREWDHRRGHVEQRGLVEPSSLGDDHRGDGAARDGAPDAEASLPDLDDVEPAPAEQLPIRDHVVRARSDEPGGHGPHREVGDVGALASPRLPAGTAPLHGHVDAHGDEEPVRAQVERAEIDGVPSGTGDVREHGCGGEHVNRAR